MLRYETKATVPCLLLTHLIGKQQVLNTLSFHTMWASGKKFCEQAA